MANADLLRRTLAHIKAHPEQWDQTAFRCGSTGCFAFHAARLAGAELTAPEPDIVRCGSTIPNSNSRVVFNDAARSLGFTENDPWLGIGEFARRALALTDAEASALFAASNSFGDLAELVEEYAAQDT
ncbi:hypothetical protein [Streptomyces sp. SBT349]|uniref:hypothetical protein n=1 Tax=Streptomyces sp. SBT349 TaxID=1580539 RepID=UPI00066EC40E|nr:hypothetical protein [Streptomyces sp. SBT349]